MAGKGNLRLVKRTCWWCGQRLMEAGHAKATDHDGNEVQVHKVCVDAVKEENRMITAWVPMMGGKIVV